MKKRNLSGIILFFLFFIGIQIFNLNKLHATFCHNLSEALTGCENPVGGGGTSWYYYETLPDNTQVKRYVSISMIDYPDDEHYFIAGEDSQGSWYGTLSSIRDCYSPTTVAGNWSYTHNDTAGAFTLVLSGDSKTLSGHSYCNGAVFDWILKRVE